MIVKQGNVDSFIGINDVGKWNRNEVGKWSFSRFLGIVARSCSNLAREKEKLDAEQVLVLFSLFGKISNFYSYDN